jgi:hypothetical protein
MSTTPRKATEKKALSLPEGFTVGMKVKSGKNGLTYEVTGPDPSSAYVKVRATTARPAPARSRP